MKTKYHEMWDFVNGTIDVPDETATPSTLLLAPNDCPCPASKYAKRASTEKSTEPNSRR
jgi:hypothetical protein